MFPKPLTLFSRCFKSIKQNTNAGFSLVMVTAIGTVGTVATAGLLMKTTMTTSQNGKIRVDNQQSLGMAEAAKTRLQSLLIEHSHLLDYSTQDWENHLKHPNSSQESADFNHALRLCKPQKEWNNKKELTLNLAQQNKIDLPIGKFSLTSFEKTDTDQIAATIETQNNSEETTKYEMEIQVFENYLSNPVPVLWVMGGENQQELGNSQVKGNLWANSCQFSLDDVLLYDPENHQAKYTGIKIPELPKLQEVRKRLPEDHFIELYQQQQKEVTEVEKTGFLTLPRPDDQPTATHQEKNVYEYLIADTNSLNSLTIDSSFQKESNVVILYISGNINIAEIIHKCQSSTTCSPENFIIVADKGDQMCLQFDHLEAVIIAPSYQLGIKSQNANGEVAKFTGTAWMDHLSTKGRCGSDQIEFNEGLQWDDLPQQFQSINPSPKLIETTLTQQENAE